MVTVLTKSRNVLHLPVVGPSTHRAADVSGSTVFVGALHQL